MFTKAILVGAFAGLTIAQSAVLTFTHVPNPVTDGEAQAITYSTNDTVTPVTITLRQGLSTDLKTVQVLTTTATAGQYVWTPAATLPNGADYALQISQGTQINYFGPFSIQGASPAGYGSSSASLSASSTAVAANVTTTTAIVSVGTASGSGYATGTALPRNTTMSMATLTSSYTSVMNTASATGNSAASTSGAGFQGSSTAAASPSGSTGNAAAGLQVGGLLALAIGAVGAVAF